MRRLLGHRSRLVVFLVVRGEDVSDHDRSIFAYVKLTGVLKEARIGVNQLDLCLHLEGSLPLICTRSVHKGDRLMVWVEQGLDVRHLIQH